MDFPTNPFAILDLGAVLVYMQIRRAVTFSFVLAFSLALSAFSR